MFRFALKRLLVSIPLLIFVFFLAFTLVYLAPGDYFDTLKTNPQISPETIEQYKTKYHLDKPVYIQFFYWTKNVIQGDLGYSFARKAPVTTIISTYAYNTFVLAFSAFIIIWSIAIPLGMYSAINRNTKKDFLISSISLFGISLPGFIFTLLLLYSLSTIPGIPSGGMQSINYENFSTLEKIFDRARHLIIPLCAICLLSIAGLMRLSRANMLEELRKTYVLNAKARGLSNKKVYYYAFRNTLNPLITLLGYEFAALLSGSAIIEIITNWPGLGSVMLDAVLQQDMYLVMGGIIVGSAMLIIGNLIADILLAINDPRIRTAIHK
jgi:peptide/nickel transport system permease protein